MGMTKEELHKAIENSPEIEEMQIGDAEGIIKFLVVIIILIFSLSYWANARQLEGLPGDVPPISDNLTRGGQPLPPNRLAPPEHEPLVRGDASGGGAQVTGLPKQLGLVRKSFAGKKTQNSIVRRVKWTDETTPYIRLGLNVQTMVILPQDEVIERIIKVHDDILLLQDGTETSTGRLRLPSNVFGLRPKGKFLEYDTNLQVITKIGRIYSFWLIVDKYDSDFTPDIKVYVERIEGGKRGIFVHLAPAIAGYGEPPESTGGITRGADKKVRLTKTEIYDELSEVLPDYVDDVEVPEDINIAYKWTGATTIMPLGVYDDGHFLYLDYRKNIQSLPVPFRVIDGVDTSVQFEVRNGFIIVKSLSKEGYTLWNGEKHVCIKPA
ncbi:MAG: TrbG/VirB9 family P-type conjugative transfer protein [Pseudomonadota bacterium]